MSLFQQKYERESFVGYLKNNLVTDFVSEVRPVVSHPGSTLTQISTLGYSESLGVTVFEAVCDEEDKGKRIAITKDAFRMLRDTAIRNALLVFTSKDSDEWRLSLLTSTLVIDKKGGIASKTSNPHRYSYLLGPQAKVATPTKFLKDKITDFADLQKRFSVEVVNNEFYKEIAKLYDQLVGLVESKNKLGYPIEGEVMHQFAVRLIGRIVFCWFLREKVSAEGKPLISRELLSIDAAQAENYYHDVLAPLFFEVLNKPLVKRPERFSTGNFGDVPYLNGGLFSQQQDDHYKFDPGTAKSLGGAVQVPDSWLRKFFELLETYNFTVDENTSVDVDLSIDPEMLGRIFENLLARINPETGDTVRKSTGSFYTPREIVEYMVDESLQLYLVNKTGFDPEKIQALISYDLDDDQAYEFTDDERRAIIHALSTLSVLDPACGSGAFPIGMLQKIVFILQQIDPDTKLWLEQQLAGASVEVRRELAKQSFDYVRKLTVIRKSIFGVDIQAIATEIARLRCFLTLIVDENIDDAAENRGIKILPNLDFKFVTANSLTKAPGTEEDAPKLFDMFEDQLADAVDEYFSAEGAERAMLSHKIRDLVDQKVKDNKDYVMNNRGIIKDQRFADAYNKKNAKQNAKLIKDADTWDSYKNIFSHQAIGFFETKYIFPGVSEGFDIVISNPPYISALAAKKIFRPEVREDFKKAYKSAKGAYDLYLLFFERGLDLIHKNGILTYISPTKYVSAKYGEAFRALLGKQNLYKIADFSNSRIFETAGVSTFVTMLNHDETRTNIITEKYTTSSRLDRTVISTPVASMEEFPEHTWGHLLSDNYTLLSKIYKESDLMESIAGVNGSSTAAEADTFSKYIVDYEQEGSVKIVNTGTIGRYNSLWGVKPYSNKKQKIMTPYLTLEHVGERRIAMYTSEKLIISKLSKSLRAMFDTKGEYASTNTTFVYDVNDQFSLTMIIAILNSNLMDFIYKSTFSGMNLLGSFQYQAPQVRILPISKRAKDSRYVAQIDELVGKLLAGGEEDPADTYAKIEAIVYDVYGLAPDEIRQVEAFLGV